MFKNVVDNITSKHINNMVAKALKKELDQYYLYIFHDDQGKCIDFDSTPKYIKAESLDDAYWKIFHTEMKHFTNSRDEWSYDTKNLDYDSE